MCQPEASERGGSSSSRCPLRGVSLCPQGGADLAFMSGARRMSACRSEQETWGYRRRYPWQMVVLVAKKSLNHTLLFFLLLSPSLPSCTPIPLPLPQQLRSSHFHLFATGSVVSDGILFQGSPKWIDGGSGPWTRFRVCCDTKESLGSSHGPKFCDTFVCTQ